VAFLVFLVATVLYGGWVTGPWFVVDLDRSIINRLFFTDRLPAALVPTLAIEVAPPAVAAGAYFALHGPTPDVFAYGLAGYAVLMVLVEVRLPRLLCCAARRAVRSRYGRRRRSSARAPRREDTGSAASATRLFEEAGWP
jgi:tellurite resistance protein TehA-like permease